MNGSHRPIADEVLVISLPERTDRRGRIEALFQREEISYRFVDGVRVQRDEIADYEISELYWADFKELAGWDSYLRAAIGCKRAHIRCLESGLEAGLSSLLVVEDDAGLVQGWRSTLLDSIADLPQGWLQLYLSAGTFRPSLSVTPRLRRLRGACQTTAILYSVDGMEAALNCIKCARAEVDFWMGMHLHPYGCSYEVAPSVTYQTGGYSDCRGVLRGPTA